MPFVLFKMYVSYLFLCAPLPCRPIVFSVDAARETVVPFAVCPPVVWSLLVSWNAPIRIRIRMFLPLLYDDIYTIGVLYSHVTVAGE